LPGTKKLKRPILAICCFKKSQIFQENLIKYFKIILKYCIIKFCIFCWNIAKIGLKRYYFLQNWNGQIILFWENCFKKCQFSALKPNTVRRKFVGSLLLSINKLKRCTKSNSFNFLREKGSRCGCPSWPRSFLSEHPGDWCILST